MPNLILLIQQEEDRYETDLPPSQWNKKVTLLPWRVVLHYHTINKFVHFVHPRPDLCLCFVSSHKHLTYECQWNYICFLDKCHFEVSIFPLSKRLLMEPRHKKSNSWVLFFHHRHTIGGTSAFFSRWLLLMMPPRDDLCSRLVGFNQQQPYEFRLHLLFPPNKSRGFVIEPTRQCLASYGAFTWRTLGSRLFIWQTIILLFDRFHRERIL